MVTIEDLAKQIAGKSHYGQRDLNGEDYIKHVSTVACMVEELVKEYENKEKYVQVAWLHDVVEDSDITLDELKELGFDENVIRAVEDMSNNKGLEYEDYIKNIESEYARVVKMADLKHNLDITRLGKSSYKELTKGQKARVNKYNKALKQLSRGDEERRLEGIYKRVKKEENKKK